MAWCCCNDIASKLRFSQKHPVRNAKSPVRNATSPEWLTFWRKTFKPIFYPLRAPSLPLGAIRYSFLFEMVAVEKLLFIFCLNKFASRKDHSLGRQPSSYKIKVMCKSRRMTLYKVYFPYLCLLIGVPPPVVTRCTLPVWGMKIWLGASLPWKVVFTIKTQ